MVGLLKQESPSGNEMGIVFSGISNPVRQSAVETNSVENPPILIVVEKWLSGWRKKRPHDAVT
jgi:hypothetical protein